jgi:hypothetical protein
MRPRANTISHVDGGTVGMIASTNTSSSRPRQSNHTHHPSLSAVAGVSGFDFRGLGTEHHHTINGLSKLEIETSGLPTDLSDGLRTAPVYSSFTADMGFNDMMMGHGRTINPAQLHFAGSPHCFASETPTSPFCQVFSSVPTTHALAEDDTSYDWVHGFDNTMTFANANESAVDGSSPSAMSTGSQSGISEVILDGSNPTGTSSTGPWPSGLLAHRQVPSNQFAMDFSATSFNELAPQPETVSPKSLLSQNQFPDNTFSTPPPLAPMGQPLLPRVSNNLFHTPMVTNGDMSGAAADHMSNSYIRNIAPSGSSDSLTDSTRQDVLSNLSASGFTNRRYSESTNNPSMSPPGLHASTFISPTYTSHGTVDLQRYLSAYINYFHPHLPFLHIPSLDLEVPGYTGNLSVTDGQANVGCLVLSMAAIGALYEFDTATSMDLFESANKTIQLYLEERRKASMSAVLNRANSGRDDSVHNPPLRLIQAMLLNVIYGHNCGDKTSADIASNHCVALVNLARVAGLTHFAQANDDVQMNGDTSETWIDRSPEATKERREWLKWKIAEERKRTLYAIYTLSSLLTCGYNYAPVLTDTEIQLDLPCEEELWAAESPEAWMELGGAIVVGQKAVPFLTALDTLLNAGQRQQHVVPQLTPFGSSVSIENPPENDLQPSAFGCLVLIHALHNCIWETRQRHIGGQWTKQETEAMHAHIEPALRAWQSAWRSNPRHRPERPNPCGSGPLSADSIPLLDLAYIRLFVNLGQSKEASWQRDWNDLAEELAREAETIQFGHDSPGPGVPVADQTELTNTPPTSRGSMADYGVADLNLASVSNQDQALQSNSETGALQHGKPSKREIYLRKAAFYAAESICRFDGLGNSFSEYTSRGLPIQCAMCTFECAQVLGEWIATVQERVGPYLGILVEDVSGFRQIQGDLLLDDEDCKLIAKIEEILSHVEDRMKCDVPTPSPTSGVNPLNCSPSVIEGGLGTKLLFCAAYLLDSAAVWPGKILFFSSLCLS